MGMDPGRLSRISAVMGQYCDDGKLAGSLVQVSRHGEVVFSDIQGHRDLERGTAMTADTIFRFYSMTKPITSVALMMLYEEGRFQLNDPVEKFIPAFANMQVYADGPKTRMITEPARSPITVQQLLTHTAGLTYDFMEENAVDALYRDLEIRGSHNSKPLAEMVDILAELPLISHPGDEWHYSLATDVCGRLVEVLSGQSLDVFFKERIFDPLGMVDTGFFVPEDKIERFAANYTPHRKGGLLLIDDPVTSLFAKPPVFLSGGGGLVSTVKDYHQFTKMLLANGELNGQRLLGSMTVDFMSKNHMPGDMAEMGSPNFNGMRWAGTGFGLGFAVLEDPFKAQLLASPGEFGWTGAASTAFWIDPVEEIICIQLTQLMPSSTYQIRRELRTLVNQAIVD